ncbi:MAG TPA: hypothetical protein VJX93_00170 [Candidatus Methanomethylophilaceae archaeon]|nr:hypothetical protein [Candidatus Methanomethylophilaceae archaeon]
MARKTSTVLSMMIGALVLLGLVVGAGIVFVTEYKATVYEYEVTGTHEYLLNPTSKVEAVLEGTVSTTSMDVFGIERLTTVSDITYKGVGDKDVKYEFGGKWNFLFSSPELGGITGVGINYNTLNHETQVINEYTQTNGNEKIVRYVGQEDEIIYRVERTITNTVEDPNGENEPKILTTIIIQDLVSYEDTKMPIKI